MDVSLTLILDIVYAAILLICFLIGIIKGWTKTLLGIILIFVAGLVANMLAPAMSNTVKGFTIPGLNDTAYNFVSTKTNELIGGAVPYLSEPIDAQLVTEHNIKALICGTLHIPSSFWPQLWNMLGPNLEAATTAEGVRVDLAIAMTAGDGACWLIAWLLCYIAIYIIGSIIISIVLAIINSARKRRSPDGKVRRPAWSRLLGSVFGLIIGAALIVGANTTAHIFTSIDPEGQILPIEKMLGIENGQQTTPSFSGWVYLVSGSINDTFFPATTETTEEGGEDLNHLVITLDKDDPSVTIPAIGGVIDQDSIPEGMDEYITVDSEGNITVDFPTTEEGYQELLNDVATASGVTTEEVESYLEAAGVEVITDEDGNVSYNVNIPTNPDEIEEWLQNLQNIQSGEGGSGGEGEGGSGE